MLENDEEIKEELEKIDNEINSQEEEDEESLEIPVENANFDKPLYPQIPQTDQEYIDILKERFGHTSFKEGQLEALKILLEKK